MNIVEYIQKSILGDPSGVVERKLNEHLEIISIDVYGFHTWSWLERSDELTLETNTIEYNLSGKDNDLSKIVSMYYGEDMTLLSDEHPDMKAFYSLAYNQIVSAEPVCFVPKERINDHTWSAIIYPCTGTTLESITYFYKKTFSAGDVFLYPNPMVFINGIMARHLTGQAITIKDSAERMSIAQLARGYLGEYLSGRELMRENDSPVTYPKIKIDIPAAEKRLLRTMKRFQRLRKR